MFNALNPLVLPSIPISWAKPPPGEGGVRDRKGHEAR
jgi:hypothetical protein